MSTVQPLFPHTHLRQSLICLHSSGSSGRQWAPITAALASRWHVVTPELLGYTGEPDWPIGTPVSLDAEAAALAPLGHAGGVHLFGHSYGGAVALQIALRWPERVKGLILYEPVRFALLFRNPATASTGESIVGVGRRIGMQVLSGALHAAAERFVDYWSGEGAWGRMTTGRQQALAGRMPKVQAEFEALFADRIPAAAYRALAMPVHLIGGTDSPPPARQVLDVLEAHLPCTTRTTLAGLGHMAPVEAPHRVLAALGVPDHDAAIQQAA